MRVPQHRARVVVALGVERGAEERVGVFVLGDAVAVAGVGPVVNGPEARRGQSGEYARVGCHAGGDGLAAAQSGGDELVGVVAVDGGAGRAAGDAAVAAANQQFARRELTGVEAVKDFAGRAVDAGAVPGEADRAGAAAEGGDLLCQGCEVASGGEFGQLGGEPGAAFQGRTPDRS